MALERPSFPQGFPPAPPSQQGSSNLDLRSRQKRNVIRSTGLVDTQWYPYHASAISKLGVDRYLDLSEMAKKGKQPKTLFSWLLKEEMSA